MATKAREKWMQFREARDAKLGIQPGASEAQRKFALFQATRKKLEPKKQEERPVVNPVRMATAFRNITGGAAVNAVTDRYLGAGAGAQMEKEAGWNRKYAGQSYGQLKTAQEGLDPQSEECRWLNRHTPTQIKTSQEAQQELEALSATRDAHTSSWYDATDANARKAYDQQLSEIEKKIRDMEGVKSQLEETEKTAPWKKKYAGQTYDQLQEALGQLQVGTEEYRWLSEYAQEQMTAADVEAALEKLYASDIDMTDTNARKAYDQQVQQLTDRKWMLQRRNRYAAIPDSADFAEKSKPATQTKTSNGARIGSGWWSVNLGGGDAKFDYINNLDSTRANYRESEVKNNYAIYDRMMQSEIDVYNYLYNTEGKDAAEEYLEYLEYALNEREMAGLQERMQKYADKDEVGSSLSSVPMSLMGGAGYMDMAMQKLINTFSTEHKPIDYNRPAMAPSIASGAIRQTVGQKIADATGTIHLDEEKHPVLSKIFNGKGLADVYQLGMSAADSAAVALLSPVIGGAGVYLLGGNAATQGVLTAVENGATEEQALMMGLVNGAAEVVFEKISLDALLKGPSDTLIKTILSQGLEEGREEVLTSVANNLADMLIMAEKSGYMKNVEQYKAQGKPEAAAVGLALADMAIDLGWDFVGGMASGGVMGGGSYAYSKASTAVENKLQQLAQKMYGVKPGNNGTNAPNNGTNAPNNGTNTPNSGTETENTAPEDGVRYSIRNTSGMSLKEQLNQYYGKKLKSSDAFYLGQTPEGLEKAGVKGGLPLTLTTSSYRKSVVDKHNIPRRVLNKLGENLQKPILSFGSNGQVGVLIDDIDADGKPVLVGIHADQTMDRETVNDIRSIYGLDNPSAWIQNQIDSGKQLEVYDEEKANKFLQTYGYQASVEGNVRSVTRIADNANAVNDKNVLTARNNVVRKDGQGEAVQVASVSDAGGGKLTLQLTDGTAAEVSELSFPDAGEQLLYETVAKIAGSAQQAQQLLEGNQGNKANAGNYARGLEEAYLYGKLQFSQAEMAQRGSFVSQLPVDQRNAAYAAGQYAGDKAAAMRRQEISGKRSSGADQGNTSSVAANTATLSPKGKVVKGQLHFDGDRSALSDRQKVSLQTCEIVAKALGIQVYVFESAKDSAGKRIGENGWYDPKDGSIHIDINAGNNGEGVMVFTLAHELTHFIRDWSPDKYRKLAGFLAEQYGEKGISVRDMVLLQQQRAEQDGRKLTFEQAHEEWVADCMETMLNDGTIVEKLSMLQAKDASLAQKIRQFLEKFLQRLKDAYQNIRPQTKEGEIVSQMVDKAQQLRDLFADALVDAGENYRNADKNTAPEGGVRLSVRNKYLTADTTEQERYELLKDAQVKLAGINKDAISHIDLETYNTRKKSSVVPGMKSLARKLGILNVDLENSKIDFPFRFSGRNLEVSLHHQLEYGGTYQDYVKAMSCFNELVENAVPIEIHSEKKAGTVKENKDLIQTYVLVSAYLDEKKIVPVQFEVKEFRERNNSLYMTVVLTKIDPEVLEAGVPGKTGNVPPLFSGSNVSLRYIFENVNEKDGRFLKYVPDGFLNDSQKEAKKKALKKQETEYAGYGNTSKRASARDQEGISPRQMLLNTVEGMVKSSAEWEQLQKYRKMIKELNATEEHLERIKAELKRLYFAEGSRDTALISSLQEQQRKAVAKLNRYDGMLISLENTKPIRDIVKRMQEAAFQKGFEKAKTYYREKNDVREQEIRQHYQESRRQAVERHEMAQIRQQIRKDVERLDGMLNRGNKQKHVKQELKAFAGAALRTAKGTFLKDYNEYDMVRNGVTGTMSREHKQILQRCQELLAELDRVRDEKSAQPGPDSMHEKWDPEAALRRDDREEALKKELAKNMAVLREAGIFKVENELMEDANSDQLMTELLAAYKDLENSEVAHIKGVYSDVIYSQMESVKKFLAGKAIKDMTAVELKELQKMYRLVLHTIGTANDLFAQKRKGDVRSIGTKVIDELRVTGKDMTPEVLEKLKKFGWNMLKPETALELIGSDALTEMMQGLYRGEDTYATDLEEARKFAAQQGEKYGRKNWDQEKPISFAGTKITLGQAMSLYAYTKRKQAQEHLETGGFTSSSNVRIKEKKGNIPVELSYIMNATKTHKVSKAMYEKVAQLLTPEQRKYVDAMQTYLSETMGAKGNEVAMTLYGIPLFEETAYFPIRVAKEHREEPLGGTKGEVKMKNSAFTKEPKPEADNPIVLDDFESVWAAHVDKMSLYHGFVLPMEDFDRVYNYHLEAEQEVTDAAGEVYRTDLVDTNETVKLHIENKMGKAANEYITQFMQQLNGGVRADPVEKLFDKGVKNFKKSAVLFSLSVAVQQPTAFIRAMAYLDLRDIADWKNFLGKEGKPDGKLIEEMYKYAPVALMKRIGGFDPNLGKTAQGYVFDEKLTVRNAIDKAAGWLPEKLDEWTWTYIWLCTKRQIHRQNPQLRVGSQEFCEKAGERFSQIIRDTQVYDSVLTKSAIMRSKSAYLQMATAFMNEPTTSMDMYIRSTIQAKRGKISKKQVARVYGSVVGSQILCAAVSAFVYAARDDDEDKTYWEKYLSKFAGKSWEGIIPFYSIPFVKDIISLLEGYDVERSDMSLWVDLKQATDKLKSDKVTPWEKTEAFAGSILNMFGIPLKNASREVRGIYNTVKQWIDGTAYGTKMGTQYAILSGLTGSETAKKKQLEDAVVKQDTVHLLRVMATYAEDVDAVSELRSAVKEVYIGQRITAEHAIRYLQTYGDWDQDTAEEKLIWWDYKRENPQTEYEESWVVNWTQELADTGISLEIYAQYRGQAADLEGDKDKNSKTISGSKKEKMLKLINGLQLSRKQKDALYLDAGYKESTIDEAPWN